MYVLKSERGQGRRFLHAACSVARILMGFVQGREGKGKEKCAALRWLFAAKKDVAAKSA